MTKNRKQQGKAAANSSIISLSGLKNNNNASASGLQNGEINSKANGKGTGYEKNSTNVSANNISGSRTVSERQKLKTERESLKLWTRPIDTTKYFTLECLTLARIYGKKLSQHKILIAILVTIAGSIATLYHVPGQHQRVFEKLKTELLFILYWLGLGVISSIGLGTGLHTFLLYLGPHIASVTLAAYECNSLDFPKPPYPDEIMCPEGTSSTTIPSLWNIMSKVRFEAFLWGAGTALGELPPYFMAKAARLSGYDPDDADDLKEFEDLQKKRALGENLTLLERGKLLMERVVERAGFWGILACASVPNPLFDLAGITCGHFLVPFGTFFGAVLLGKAIVKMHVQKLFVIVAFSEHLFERVIDLLGDIPVVGRSLQEPFKAFLIAQKEKYHRGSAANVSPGGNKLQKVFEIFVIAMIVYFIVSIINAFAQSYHKRLQKKKSGKDKRIKSRQE